MIEFIKGYDISIEEQAKSFSGVKSFNRFVRLVKVKRMEDLFDMKSLRTAVYQKHPILVLHDIGGSILYRTDAKVAGDRKVDFTVRKHIHYYRPSKDAYLKFLCEHPRVKFAFYTAIMRKNVMPLLVDLFKSQELRLCKSKVFEIFDQEYNVPDISPGKEVWAKKRHLPKIFESDKI